MERPLSKARSGAGRNAGELRLRSYAKVNLGLEVLGPRLDGYHELRTIFQTIGLHDDVLLRRRPQGLSVRCDHPAVPLDDSNLALRAARDLQRYARVEDGVEIVLTKRIPVAGGLGGGSSNAATVLMGLDRLWRLGLGTAGLHPLARRLGADVPYFLVGGTALGLARGDEVYPLHRQVRAHVVVVDPERPLSTAAVFQRLDRGLTPREDTHRIFRFVSSHLAGEDGSFPILANDLEPPALEEAPDLAARLDRIRGILVREGALMASLSGSGASYFGLFDDPQRARRAQSRLEARGFKALRSRTLSLDQYRRLWAPPAFGRARGSDQGRSGHHGDHRRQGHPRRR
ncbi:MAG TPA: 4-(cytidine 5'-diphospho)-2-C-methyl-D-erythritol kinase [Vicinamibacteria bacterium]|nr:4-(cytidine 5'-diphospho)-2-C-methyl-D-erythritol kinase [Vicinamibacteria bacterium]